MKRRFTQSDFFLRSIHPFLAKIPGYDYYLLRRKSYLKETGWFKSFKKTRSIDAQSNPLPWFTYTAIELLKERLPENLMVFEYGCGHGTLWWAARSRKLFAVEHDEKWLAAISRNSPPHVFIELRPLDSSYSGYISQTSALFDVIIIDGKERNAAATISVEHLTEQGIIIFDDTNLEIFEEGVQTLKEAGFRQLPFRGFSPIEFLPCETSIFYRSNNLLGI
ncbi:MAG: FkbM family methyltransferase [Balneolaceae bacterium]|nr:MAG: FkbM family methyltransferase [Balneolaceae bacterium]